MTVQDQERAAARFISPCQPPNPVEREVLTILGEECAEVAIELATVLGRIQVRASKMLRFGILEVQPGQPHDNVDRLSHEIGDLLVMLQIAESIGLIRTAAVDAGQEHKRQQLAKFFQTHPGAPT